jgi:serine/threonine-protein kinase
MSGSTEARLAAGAQFGAYRVVRPLGEGAAGAVYEVVKTSVGKRMALKVLHRSLHDGGDDLVRFQREAMVAGTIEHPNVVQVFDVGELEGFRYMAMELLEGETLESRLAREGALPVRDVADLFVPLLSALGAVHDRGVVHRDLKPGNIFLVARRPGVVEPKLLDFGVIKDLSGIVGGDITRAHSMVGSPAYMSPEQAERPDAIDVRSDQFTMGAILWECLIGRKLFQGDTLYQVLFQVAEGPIPPPTTCPRASTPR